MLVAVQQQAAAIASMQPSDKICLTQQQYLDIFRLQQEVQQGHGLPQCFPEQQIKFAFEAGGLIFAVNHPGSIRRGIPGWTGEPYCLFDQWTEAVECVLEQETRICCFLYGTFICPGWAGYGCSHPNFKLNQGVCDNHHAATGSSGAG